MAGTPLTRRWRMGVGLAAVAALAVVLAVWAILLIGCPSGKLTLDEPADAPTPSPRVDAPRVSKPGAWMPAGDDLLIRVLLADRVERVTIAVAGPFRLLVDDVEQWRSDQPLQPSTLARLPDGRWQLGIRMFEGRTLELLPQHKNTLRVDRD